MIRRTGLLLAIVAIITSAVIACNKDDDEVPTVSLSPTVTEVPTVTQTS